MIFKKLAANLCMVGALFSPMAHALDADEVRKVRSWDLVGRILKLAGCNFHTCSNALILLCVEPH